jgi:acyl carrier protein
MDLEQRVSEIIVEQLGVSRDDIESGSSFTDDLGADSLDLVEMVMAMEEEFGVEIPEEDSEKLQTFGDAVAYLKGKLKAD